MRVELDLDRDLGPDHGLFLVQSRATSKDEYLLRPDLGRLLDPIAIDTIRRKCPAGADFQVVIGDGLSPAAVGSQVPMLLPLLMAGAGAIGWRVGRPFAVRYCRVGLLNDVGEALNPSVVVLLIGERPGLATTRSLSAYLAFRPRTGHTDAHRNLISNIHASGTSPAEAADRILNLAGQMIRAGASGGRDQGRPGREEHRAWMSRRTSRPCTRWDMTRS